MTANVGSINALAVRRTLGVSEWGCPQRHGPDGWAFVRKDCGGSVIVSCASFDGAEYVHASIAIEAHMPTYDDLVLLHRAAFAGYAYQVFAPPEQHVNIHAHALHLWGRLDGRPVLPEFGLGGSI